MSGLVLGHRRREGQESGQFLAEVGGVDRQQREDAAARRRREMSAKTMATCTQSQADLIGLSATPRQLLARARRDGRIVARRGEPGLAQVLEDCRSRSPAPHVG